MSTGKNENLTVQQIMLPIEQFPIINERALFKEAIDAMNTSRLGMACIVNTEGKLLGIITDGDIRRKLTKIQKPFSALFVDDALEHAVTTPTVVAPKDTLLSAVEIMETKQIWDLPVVESGKLVGLVHLHPAVKALLGIA